MNPLQDKRGNPLKALQAYGQSVWLDYIRRSLITSGELKRLVEEDGLRGVTSNPAIFEKAITGSSDYAVALKSLQQEKGLNAKAIYERLAVQDIQDAADVLRPVYEVTKRRDGYVSLEVSPHLARDTQGTLQEARRLWKAVGRENVMIKVPATPEGIPAIRQLISEGINVNVTLLFAQEAYQRVAEAYIAGLEQFVVQGGTVSKVASVASFFISRIDSAIDAIIAARLKTAPNPTVQALLRSLLGKVAIANGKETYQLYLDLFRGERWRALETKGAQTQRVLWASTSTKNPAYRDVVYVEELIGPDTVNTIPPSTFDAYRDHGRPRASLVDDIEGAQDTMETLERVGISMKEVTDKLLKDGLQLFADPFDKLLAAVDRQCKVGASPQVNRQTFVLPQPLAEAVKASLDEWRRGDKVRRLWSHDPSLWTDTDEGNWLGWLGITEDQLVHLQPLGTLAEETQRAGFAHAMVLGMGGSTMCPEVMKMTFGKVGGFPELHVLDSTDPAQIKTFENRVDLGNTLFIVSSKSGGTLEPNIFKQYFFDRVTQVLGAKEAGQRFIAVTDPGSKMQQVAESEGFRHILFGVPSIGGRYSALSNFGMVPSAIMGVDVARFLDRAEEMVQACSSCVPIEENPGVVLGTILGVLATKGRDKVTLIISPGVSDLGAWLEQLLAESTGKEGKGLIPVDREPLGPPDVYGNDRVFVYVRLASAPDASQDAAVEALEGAGQPIVRISIADIYDLGQEFFRWEIATAVAGSIIRINAFNQPDVEASKVATRKLTSEYEKAGSLPPETPIFEGSGIKLFADPRNAAELKAAAGQPPSLAGYLKAHLRRLAPGDYFALLAYIEMNGAHEEQLQAARRAVRDKKCVATCLGFGPRFLHSTGQAYKGGPNSGVFLQITCDDANDIPVPGQKYTFGVVKAAQARGDFQVLVERGRRALRAHLGRDVKAGLAMLRKAVEQALA
ncbi:bifunctional transaldolase/phosoglucose isomerase [Nitrospiraceae bacterium AH_259_D15_M11_P09]|nr:bifunctional transaldolase/phosoglucose isomerase [Nitrospiraceae bacterium AH_259_D15_M11_P09]